MCAFANTLRSIEQLNTNNMIGLMFRNPCNMPILDFLLKRQPEAEHEDLDGDYIDPTLIWTEQVENSFNAIRDFRESEIQKI